jgi:hypothetical protein
MQSSINRKWHRTPEAESTNKQPIHYVHRSVPLYTSRKCSGERSYSSYSISTSSLDGFEWSASRSGRALALGKGPPVPIVQEAGWAPEPVWTQRLEEKSFRLCRESNLDRPVVQPVARYYTDWATRLTRYTPHDTKFPQSTIHLTDSLSPLSFCHFHCLPFLLFPFNGEAKHIWSLRI